MTLHYIKCELSCDPFLPVPRRWIFWLCQWSKYVDRKFLASLPYEGHEGGGEFDKMSTLINGTECYLMQTCKKMDCRSTQGTQFLVFGVIWFGHVFSVLNDFGVNPAPLPPTLTVLVDELWQSFMSLLTLRVSSPLKSDFRRRAGDHFDIIWKDKFCSQICPVPVFFVCFVSFRLVGPGEDYA